jgi:hypothetical protein
MLTGLWCCLAALALRVVEGGHGVAAVGNGLRPGWQGLPLAVPLFRVGGRVLLGVLPLMMGFSRGGVEGRGQPPLGFPQAYELVWPTETFLEEVRAPLVAN